MAMALQGRIDELSHWGKDGLQVFGLESADDILTAQHLHLCGHQTWEPHTTKEAS